MKKATKASRSKNLLKRGELTKARNHELYLNGLNRKGNEKLVNCINQHFLIWNLPSVFTCPYATEHCIKECYARKAELQYPDCLPCRTNNYKITLDYTFVLKMVWTLYHEILAKFENCKAKKVQIRIHESGDFYSQAYFDMWCMIINYINELLPQYKNRIVFMAYTKSFVFVKNTNQPIASNFTIRASIWDDTEPEQIELAKSLNLPIYTADTKENIDTRRAAGEQFHFCRCSDCANCQCCQNKKVDKILCEIH